MEKEKYFDELRKDLKFNPEYWQGIMDIEKAKSLTMINYIPANKRVLILKYEKPELISPGGIIIDSEANDIDNPREKSYIGMIVALAADHRLNDNPMGLVYRPGDLILYAIDKMNRIEILGQDFYVMTDFDVHGMIPKNSEHIKKIITLADPDSDMRQFWENYEKERDENAERERKSFEKYHKKD